MIRLDRFLTLNVFRHLKRILPQPNGILIPILMYHSISDDPEDGIHPYYRINTSPKRFAEHMQFLDDNNYKVIDLSEAVKIISETSASPHIPTSHHSNIPQKKVVLTFDDGYRDFYVKAFPILKKYGFSATVFLPTAFIGSKRSGLKDKEHLTWDEVVELYREGITFGSHTVTHQPLKILKGVEIKYEIEKSKEIIENNISNRVESFSYPYAFPDGDSSFIRRLKILLKESGYLNGVCTRVGTIQSKEDIYFLKRIPLNSDDLIPFFDAKLVGGYDWFRKSQLIHKMLISYYNKIRLS